MRTFPRLITTTLILASVLFLWPDEAKANVVLDLTIEEMAVRADVVVHGRVTAIDTAWDDSHRRIFTNVDVQVVTYIAGAGPQIVRIRQVGGRVGDEELAIAGQPSFTVGQEVVLFLEPDGSSQPNQWVVLCMSLGMYRITDDAITGERVVGQTLNGLNRTPGPGRNAILRPQAIRPLLLRELVDRVRSARSAQGGAR